MVQKVPVSHGRRTVWAIVDDEDYDLAKAHTWWLVCNRDCGYVVGQERRTQAKGRNRRRIYLHWLVVQNRGGHLPTGFKPDRATDVHHGPDHKPLNNTRANLEVMSHAANVRRNGPRNDNTSGYRCVFRDGRPDRWRYQFQYHKVRYHKGGFSSRQDAAAACRKLRGEVEAMRVGPSRAVRKVH